MLIENLFNRLTFNIVSLLKQCLRGSAVFCLVMALKPACAGVVIVSCNVLLGQHNEIPVQDYLVVAKDTQRDSRLRECAAYAYARTYPESFREFIKMLYANDGNARQIAEFALSYFGPSAKEAVPHLMGMFRNLHTGGGLQALINIGVNDRASLDMLLNLALDERNHSAIHVLSGQKSLPAYIGPLIISAIEKGDRKDAQLLVDILLPIMDDLSIDYFVRFKLCGSESNDRCGRDWPWGYSTSYEAHQLKAVGNIAIRPLFKSFRGYGDINARALSLVMLMGIDSPEAKALAQQLAQELIPILRADLLDTGHPKSDVDRFDWSLNRLIALGPLVNPLGKELLPLLDEQTIPWLRYRIVHVLQKIEYVEALPRLRQLAIDKAEREERLLVEEAIGHLEYLEKMDRSQ